MRKAVVIILTVFLAGCSASAPELGRQERINQALAHTLNQLIESHNQLIQRMQELEPAKK